LPVVATKISGSVDIIEEGVNGFLVEPGNSAELGEAMRKLAENENLDDLDTGDVFNRCLDAFNVPNEDRDELTASYNEIIKSLHEEDVNAE